MEKIPSPCYVIEEKLLRKNLSIIKNVANSANIEIIMALKAFSMWSVFPIIREYVKTGTASSLHEARLIFEHFNAKAHIYSPAYKDEEFDEIQKYCDHIIFNSLHQLEHFSNKINKDIKIGLRINPEYSPVSTELYNACTPGTRFGITAENLPDNLPKNVSGLHFHALCESDSYALEEVLSILEQKFGRYFHQIEWLNLGGGHLMTNKGYDTKHLIKILKAFKQKHHLDIILEPGSAFTWQTGFLKSKIIDIVENKGIKTAILDVSFTAHMPDCLEMPYKPIIRGALEPAKDLPTYRMGGNSCLSGDFVGDWSFKKELKIGDSIIFEDMIHYTMVKTTTFNGVTHPSIGMIDLNGHFKLIKKFGYEDFKNRLS